MEKYKDFFGRLKGVYESLMAYKTKTHRQESSTQKNDLDDLFQRVKINPDSRFYMEPLEKKFIPRF